MKHMTEPISSIFTVKGFITLAGFTLAGLANAILSVKKDGWKGFGLFVGDIIVAVSAGQIIYSFLIAVDSSLALPVGFAAAYIGPGAVRVLWNSFVATIKPAK